MSAPAAALRLTRRRWLQMAGAGLCGAALSAWTPRGRAAELLRIGYQKSSINLLLARDRGFFERTLPDLSIRWIEFPAGPQLLEALNAGSLDFGMTGDTPPVFAQAAGAQLMYVGAEPPKPGSSAILVAETSPIHTLADLRGRRVAFQRGSSAHYLVLRALTVAGLHYSDIEPVHLPPAEARAAFTRGAVDAWAIWDPYWAAAEEQAGQRVLSDGHGLSDNNTFYLASPALLRDHAAWLDGIFAALTQADIYAQTQRRAAIASLAGATGLTPEVVARVLQRRPPSPVGPLSADQLAAQQALADAYAGAGLIPAPIHVAERLWRRPAAT